MTPLAAYGDRTALITGGGSGIGFGLAQALVERGARVALIGTDPGRLDAALERLAAPVDRAIAVVLDVTDAEGWSAAADRVEDVLGPIDLLALNAGAQGRRRSIEDIPWEEWRWVWDVNVNGLYHGLRAVLPRMKRRGAGGHVLITASIAALTPRPLVTAYGASKAAALALGEALRLELQDGPIGVSVLCPAAVRSSIAETMLRHAPGADADTFAFMQPVLAQGLDPLEVGRFTLDAMAERRFYIFTHPEFGPQVQSRFVEIAAAFVSASDQKA